MGVVRGCFGEVRMTALPGPSILDWQILCALKLARRAVRVAANHIGCAGRITERSAGVAAELCAEIRRLEAQLVRQMGAK